MACAGDKPADGACFLANCLHCVGGACGHACVCGVEHFQVIVAVADGKAAVGGDAVVGCDVAQASAFLVFAVAEAQID